MGVTGEVAIGGMGVTKGYHKRPELTAEKFIVIENDRLIYKTGDQGRLLPDGNLEILGRIDNQIKLHGFRIEPGEIENQLSSLLAVKEAVVKVHKFDDNDERLVAFLNVEANFIMTNEEIKNALSKSLPAYMVPSFYQRSDGFPRLPNGKINKKALVLEISSDEPKTLLDTDLLSDTEKKLINLWETVLKIKNIDFSRSLFDNGGTSLQSIYLANLISKEFKISFTPQMIFEFPKLKDQSEFLSGHMENSFSYKKDEIAEKMKSKRKVNFKRRQ